MIRHLLAGSLSQLGLPFAPLRVRLSETVQPRCTQMHASSLELCERSAWHSHGRPPRKHAYLRSDEGHFVMLCSLEGSVMDVQAAPYVRVFSWWLSLQNWCTMHFSDHRGIVPKSRVVTGSVLTARLTRSKLSVRISLSVRGFWLSMPTVSWCTQRGCRLAGLSQSQQLAPFGRDCLFPDSLGEFLGLPALGPRFRFAETGCWRC